MIFDLKDASNGLLATSVPTECVSTRGRWNLKVVLRFVRAYQVLL